MKVFLELVTLCTVVSVVFIEGKNAGVKQEQRKQIIKCEERITKLDNNCKDKLMMYFNQSEE